MNQLWIVEGQLVYSGGYCRLLGTTSQPSGKLNYAFYDERTADVWGKRINSEGGGSWIFVPGIKPDLRLPYEKAQNFLPDSYFEFLLAYLIQYLTPETKSV